ncbi:MAG: hypothetical protein ACFCBW_22890 [Candidatus Competibacterales bacterium]
MSGIDLYGLPEPEKTGEPTVDRRITQAYERLRTRLETPNLSSHDIATAITHYRRVMNAILGPEVARRCCHAA